MMNTDRHTRRRIILLYALGLILLFGTLYTLFFFLPHYRTHRVVLQYEQERGREETLSDPDIAFVPGRCAEDAIQRLGGSERALDRLVSYMRLRRYTVPFSARPGPAAELIARCGEPGVRVLIEDLRGGDYWTRARAARALIAAGPEAKLAIPDLIHALGDGRHVNSCAMQVLANTGEDAVPALLGVIGSPDRKVRSHVALVLGLIGSKDDRVADALAKALGDPEVGVRYVAAGALGTAGSHPEKVVPALAKALEDAEYDWHVAKKAAESLGKIGPPARGAVPALRRALDEMNGDLRCNAAFAIWRITGDQDTAVSVLSKEVLGPHFDDPRRRVDGTATQAAAVRMRAADLLGEMGPAAEGAVPVLMRVLRDDAWAYQEEAAIALGRIGAISVLKSALRDENASVRAAARQALLNIGAGEVLKESLGPEKPEE